MGLLVGADAVLTQGQNRVGTHNLPALTTKVPTAHPHSSDCWFFQAATPATAGSVRYREVPQIRVRGTLSSSISKGSSRASALCPSMVVRCLRSGRDSLFDKDQSVDTPGLSHLNFGHVEHSLQIAGIPVASSFAIMAPPFLRRRSTTPLVQ